jgi:DNA-binding NtrC family response regulator
VLPPLRDRGADIELLAETFTAQLASASGLAIPPLSNETRQALRAHAWPGNVRELRNVIERALVLSPPGVLLLPPFPAPRAQPTGTGTTQAGPLPFPATLHDIQSAAVHAMLAACQGNKSEAARRLGISRPRLQRLLEGASE